MKTKPTYPPPIFAVNHVVTIRTFAISLPAPTQGQNILAQSQRPSSARLFNPAPPQSITHADAGKIATSASTVPTRCFIDTTKHAKTNNSAFIKVKLPKPLLGVPEKIPQRPQAVSSGSFASKTTPNRLEVPPKASTKPFTTQSQPAVPAQSAEKRKSAPSLKRKHLDFESINITSTNPSQRFKNTLENSTKRHRQSFDTTLVCPNCGEGYNDGVKAFEHLVMCRSTRSREPSSLVPSRYHRRL